MLSFSRTHENKILYVSDLDGTLLNTEDRIPEYSLDILNNLIGQGMAFTYATARSLSSASIVTKGLQLQFPVIVYNGAFTMDSISGEIIDSNYFSNEEKRFVSDLMISHNIFPLVYSFIGNEEKVSWFVEKENDGFRRYIENRKGDKRLNPLHDQSDLYKGNNFYYTCIGEKEELLPLFNALKENSGFNCILQQELYRPEYWCEIMPKRATTANAIHKLKSCFNCRGITSFGDALNDIPMFEISDKSFAVANAAPELKKFSTEIIGSNNNNGVALWLKENWRI